MKRTGSFSGILCSFMIASMLCTGCVSPSAESVSENITGETTSVAPQFYSSDAALATEPKYAAKEGLQTILFMGLDKYEPEELDIGYLNDQQCDFLMLLILDKEAKTCDVLHLNRDTMTEIRRLGIGGGVASRFIGQLALAHTYGSGGSDSCINVCKAVSTLLKDVKIDHYVSLSMAGVSILNDLAGGVEVTIPVDMTTEDPSFVKGEKVLLKGNQSLAFVRARGGVGDQSNVSRMERQRIYLTELYNNLLFQSHEDKDFVNHSLLKLTSYMQSDLSINQLDKLVDEIQDYTLNPFTTIEGESVAGDEFMEFYVDEESLKDVLIDLFTE